MQRFRHYSSKIKMQPVEIGRRKAFSHKRRQVAHKPRQLLRPDPCGVCEPNKNVSGEEHAKHRSSYALQLLNCMQFLCMLTVHVPGQTLEPAEKISTTLLKY